MSRRVAIVGAGITGLVAARELARRGYAVSVFERWPDVGGQASTFDLGDGRRIERYYHHLFPSDREMIALHDELAPGELEWHRSSVAMYASGRLWPFTGPRDLLAYGPLSPLERVRLGLAVLRLQRVREWEPLDDVRAVEWLRGACGRRALEMVWEPLLLAKFGDAAADVPLAWLWSKLVLRRRLEGRGLREELLGYPRSSFDAISRALSEDVVRRGGAIHVDRGVLGVVRADGGAYRLRLAAPGWYRDVHREVARGDDADAEAVLFTTPTFSTARLADWPDDYGRRLDGWGYRAAVVLLLELRRPFSDRYWINVAQPGVPFVGLIEHTNLVPAERYGARYLYVSHYVARGDPLLALDAGALLARALPHLRAIAPGFGEADVLRRWAFREDAAQPIPHVGGRMRVLPFASPREGLFVANTTQIHPEDRGTNYSVRLGRNAAEAIAGAIGPA